MRQLKKEEVRPLEYYFYHSGDSPTSPADTDSPMRPADTEIPSNVVDPGRPVLAARGTRSPSSTPLAKNGLLWVGVVLGLVILAIAIAVAIKQKKSSNKRRHHATARTERRPLMACAKLGEF